MHPGDVCLFKSKLERSVRAALLACSACASACSSGTTHSAENDAANDGGASFADSSGVGEAPTCESFVGRSIDGLAATACTE